MTTPQLRPYRVWAEIDLAAYRRNMARFKAVLTPGTKVLAVVKADAYGHGAIPCARAIEDMVDYLGVGDSQEALELRQGGVTKPILILGAIIEGEMPRVIAEGISACLHTAEHARQMDVEARRQGVTAKVHILVDTGMTRLGVSHTEVGQIFRTVKECPNLELEGVATHFSSPAEPNRAFSNRQIEHFMRVVDLMRDLNLDPPLIHAANSPARLNYEAAEFTMVRPGLCMYGQTPPQWHAEPIHFEPILSLRTQIIFLREAVREGTPVSYGRLSYTHKTTDIATLPVGYNDGYRRNFSLPSQTGERGEVFCNGIRCPLLGSITMDYTMVDVGHVPGAAVGNIVTLIGKDPLAPEDVITVEQLAALAGTIPYEVTCGLGRRVVRLYRLEDTGEYVPWQQLFSTL